MGVVKEIGEGLAKGLNVALGGPSQRRIDRLPDPMGDPEGYRERVALPVEFAPGDLAEVTGFGDARFAQAQEELGEVAAIAEIRTRAGFIQQPAANTEVA